MYFSTDNILVNSPNIGEFLFITTFTQKWNRPLYKHIIDHTAEYWWCDGQIGKILENEAKLVVWKCIGGDEEEIPCYRSHHQPHSLAQHSNTFASQTQTKKVIMQWFENTRICKKSRDLVLMEVDNKEIWGRKRSRETFVMAPKHEAGRTIFEWQVRTVACFATYWVLQQQCGILLRPSDELVVP